MNIQQQRQIQLLHAQQHQGTNVRERILKQTQLFLFKDYFQNYGRSFAYGSLVLCCLLVLVCGFLFGINSFEEKQINFTPTKIAEIEKESKKVETFYNLLTSEMYSLMNESGDVCFCAKTVSEI